MIGAVSSSAVQGWMALASVAASGLVAAVWQGILLSLLVAIGLRLLPKTPAAVRFAIWFGVFLLVAALPLAGLLHCGEVAASSGHSEWVVLDERWCFVIAAVWVVASAVRAVTLLLAAFRVRALWKRATPLEPSAVDGAPGMAFGSSGCVGSRRAEICVSEEIDRPTVIGFFSPKILIPAWLVEKLTSAELDQIVLHEAGHLSRADDWMNLLQKIALVVFPLNPALAWVERRLCFERELACDERVLKTTGAPKAYAECLASLAEHRLARRGLALALGVLGRESELGRRVARILRRRELMRPFQAKLLLGGAMLALLTVAAGIERCPQVIGFAADSNSAIAATQRVHLGDGMRTAYSYQPVVFHPAVAAASFVTNAPHERRVTRPLVKLATQQVPVGDGVLRASWSSGTAVDGVARVDESIRGRRVSDSGAAMQNVAEQGGAPRVTEWVVMTSWRGDDGSRVVLTTVETSRPASDAQDRSMGTAAASPQNLVHPYAAVPVRDGWLVIQL
jgi:hypothetical protein